MKGMSKFSIGTNFEFDSSLILPQLKLFYLNLKETLEERR